MNNFEIKKGVIRPVECFREGWELIRDRFWLFFAITLVGFIIASLIPFCILMGAMFCGIYVALGEKYEGREPKFEQLFTGFSFFMPSLIATLIWAVPLTIGFLVGYIPLIILQFSLDRNSQPDPETIFATLGFTLTVFGLMTIIWIFFHPFIMLVYQIIAEKEVSGFEALKLSFRGVWQNLGGMVGLLVLNMLAYSAGVLLCGIGAYFALPLIFANTYVAYRKIFPSEPRDFSVPPPPNAFRGAGSYT